MTMKQIEAVTGMARANIRYYEAEGLLCPERKENGYRVYSDGDAQTLLKIKLLRCLDVSIEELKAIQSGTLTLQEALHRSSQTLEAQRAQVERAAEVTRLMLMEKPDYATLDAGYYLQRLESREVLQTDRVQTLNLPWRRFWARDFDYLLCALLAGSLMPDSAGSMIRMVASLLTMVLLEPLCLRLFATTPGKAIFGIRVTDPEGGRLRYRDAMERTCTVLWEGECMRLPLISIYFHYRSYQAAEAGEALPWEENSELTIRDDSAWRYLLYFLILSVYYYGVPLFRFFSSVWEVMA